MAQENENGQEKTEQPTPKKLREAKEKGQVPRSRELNSMTSTVLGAVGMMAMGSYMYSHISTAMTAGLTLDKEVIFSRAGVFHQLNLVAIEGILTVAPFLFLMLLVVIFTPMLIGGWTFSFEAMALKFSRLNPVTGLQRIFSVRGLVELLKSVGKVMVIAVVASTFLWFYSNEILGLSSQPVKTALEHGAWLVLICFLVVASSLILIAAIDVPFQIWDHAQKLKMTLQEVRDELKETEGKPEVKSKVRQVQQELAQRRMMEAVPEADVVITNPTHFAVALKYEQASMSAPIVVAMGQDLIALKIREVAKANQVEIFEAPPLARALYANSKIDQEIPAHLYFAVAQVLAFVFQLRMAKETGGDLPERPQPFLDEEGDE